MAVCAVARRRAVGIDVENRLRPMRFMQVARRFFAPSEVEALTALPEEERPAGFYRFWTLKEAYVKARGVGIASMPLASFWFRLDDAAPPAISFAHPEAEQRRWEFSLFHPTDRHIVALAVEQSGAGTTSAQLRLTLPLAPAR
jgi:4'-phosphopantetheinyl transferase